MTGSWCITTDQSCAAVMLILLPGGATVLVLAQWLRTAMDELLGIRIFNLFKILITFSINDPYLLHEYRELPGPVGT
jgi:hypothetical protein